MKYLSFILLLLAPTFVFADSYNLTANWSDPTVVSADYVPAYNVEYRIGANTGTAPGTPVSNLPTPSWSGTITAAPGTKVEVRVQNKNTIGPLLSAWSPWVAVTAPYGSTPPLAPTGFTVTITHLAN
jgi:hypothetical protein